jgi:hypothetical protein
MSPNSKLIVKINLLWFGITEMGNSRHITIIAKAEDVTASSYLKNVCNIAQ